MAVRDGGERERGGAEVSEQKCETVKDRLVKREMNDGHCKLCSTTFDID